MTNGISHKDSIQYSQNVEGSKVLLYVYLCEDFALTSSAEPDERLHYAAFHLGLHCLPKYPFRGFWFSNGYTNTHA